jgi:lysophospholipase L1-like esterase
LREVLGADWTVIEEGLSGRTTVHPDPIEGHWLDGSAYLPPCLRSHSPLEAIIILLGTNDLKARFSAPPGDIAAGIGVLLRMVAEAEAGPDGSRPEILVICPPAIVDHHGERPDLTDMFAGGRAKSLRLAPLYAAVAEEHGAAFLDAGSLIESSAYDGIHLDLDAHEKLGRAAAATLLRLVEAH